MKSNLSTGDIALECFPVCNRMNTNYCYYFWFLFNQSSSGVNLG